MRWGSRPCPASSRFSAKVFVRVLPALLLGFAALQPARADNMVLNPGFDTDLSYWTVTGATWDGSLDAEGSPRSGSARTLATGLPSSNVCFEPVTQCVPVLPEGRYDFGGKLFIPAGQGDGSATVELQVFGDGACTYPLFTGFKVGPTSATGVWVTRGFTVQIPPSGGGVLIVGLNCPPNRGGDFVVNFDDFFVGSAPVVEVVPTLDDATIPCFVVLLAACGLWRLRRHSAGEDAWR